MSSIAGAAGGPARLARAPDLAPNRVTDQPSERIPEYQRIRAENERYADVFDRSRLTAAPLSGLAIVTCMDARIDVEEALGLRVGDAHIIRNAGATATQDAIRSLIVSQQLLGTDEILLIAHTGCGLERADEAALSDRLAAETGRRLEIEFGAFDDLEDHVRVQVDRLRTHAWVRRVAVHGLIYDVATGRLHEVA
jgi:carbonic anhydrase